MENLGVHFATPQMLEVSTQVVKGIKDSVHGFAELIAHPIDKFVRPVSKFIYDASIIAAYHTPGLEETSIMHSLLSRNPGLYHDAVRSMDKRISDAKAGYRNFENADPKEQIRIMSGLISSVYVPGAFVNGIRRLKNLTELGTANPPVFRPKIIEDAENFKIKTYTTAAELRNKPGVEYMIYTYTTDNELLISSRFFEGKTRFGEYVLHTELAKLKDVYVSGEFILKDGRIFSINNASGHYHPTGEHLGTLVQRVFNRAGFDEVNPNIYHASQWKPYPNYGQLYPRNELAAAVFGGVANGIQQEERITENGNLIQDRVYPNVFLDDDDISQEYTEAAKQTGKVLHEIVPLAQNFDIDDIDTKKQLLKAADTLYEFGTIGVRMAQIATMVGGHRRTWNGVAKVGESAMTFAMSLTQIMNSMSFLGTVSGGLGLVMGAIGIFQGLFGDDDDDNGLGEALQAIHQSIIAVHQAVVDLHNDMIKCFQRVEELMVVSIIPRLELITSRLDRLERITLTGFKELHTKSLASTVDAIQKDLRKEFLLNTEERRHYMRKLTCWIDNYSKSAIQTNTLQSGGDTQKKCLVIQEITLESSLSLFVHQLRQLVPWFKTECDLPNLELLSVIVDIYAMVCRKYGIDSKVILGRTKEMLTLTQTVCKILNEELIGGETISQILFRQYKKYRLEVGLQIAKIRAGAVWKTGALEDQLREGVDKERLMQLLDEMELRRLCILKLGNEKLESKKDILNTQAEKFNQNSDIYSSKKEKIATHRRCVEMGSDINVYNHWGKPIHYVTSCGFYTKELHFLFQCDADMTGGTKIRKPYRPAGWTPILYTLNNTLFSSAVLFVANGFDVNEADGRYNEVASHTGNLYSRKEIGWWTACVTVSLLKDCIRNKDDLRKAYTFYKTTQAGFWCNTDFSLDSILLLMCVVGDIFPLKVYLKMTNQELLEETIDPRYIYIAMYNKNHDVLEFVNADLQREITVDGIPTSTIEKFSGLRYRKPEKVIVEKQELPLLNTVKEFSNRVAGYLEFKPEEQEESEYDIYYELLKDVVSTVPEECKHYTRIHKSLKSLRDAIDSGDKIKSSFVLLSSLLKVSVPDYGLHESILTLE